jgi:hypothetical protein
MLGESSRHLFILKWHTNNQLYFQSMKEWDMFSLKIKYLRADISCLHLITGNLDSALS